MYHSDDWLNSKDDELFQALKICRRRKGYYNFLLDLTKYREPQVPKEINISAGSFSKDKTIA